MWGTWVSLQGMGNSRAGLRLTLRPEHKCVYNATSGHHPQTLVVQGLSRQQDVGAWNRALVGRDKERERKKIKKFST